MWQQKKKQNPSTKENIEHVEALNQDNRRHKFRNMIVELDPVAVHEIVDNLKYKKLSFLRPSKLMKNS